MPAPGLRLRSSGVRLAEDPAAPSRGDGDSAATEVTDEDATDATVSAAGDRSNGERRWEKNWKRGASDMVGDSWGDWTSGLADPPAEGPGAYRLLGGG